MTEVPVHVELSRVDWRRVERIEWVQPRVFSERWLLMADGGPSAELRGRGFWKRGWAARTPDAEWMISDPVFGPPGITRAGVAEPVARGRLRLLAPTPVERATGPVLEWRWLGIPGRSHVLATTERLPLITVRSRLRWFRSEADVRLEDAARELPDLDALLLLTWGMVLSGRQRRRT